LRALILAAGKGERMRSRQVKILHKVGGQPILEYVLQAVTPLKPEEIILVVGHQGEQVQERFAGRKLVFVEQKEQLGTGHALLQTRPVLQDKGGELLILPGDLPLLQPEPLKKFITFHRGHGGRLSLLTMEVEDPRGYGRIVRGRTGEVEQIVEDRDATAKQREICEVNSGIYLVRNDRLLWETLAELEAANAQGEYYLTDIIALYRDRGEVVQALVSEEGEGLLGVNSRAELARAEAILKRRTIAMVMERGATVIAPETVSIERSAEVERDAVIGQGSAIRGRSRIGEGALVEGSTVEDFIVSAGSRITMSLLCAKEER